jgi:hypothetical protein
VTDAGEVVLEKALFSANSPAHGVAILNFSEPVNGSVHFFNTIGQAVRMAPIAGETTIEVAGLQPGSYALQFRGEKGMRTVTLLVN